MLRRTLVMARKAQTAAIAEVSDVDDLQETGDLETSSWKFEALGIAVILFGFGFTLALISHQPGDPTASERLVGPAGRTLAHILLTSFGLLGTIYVLGTIFSVGIGLVSRTPKPSQRRITSMVAAAFASLILAHLIFGATIFLGHPIGGVLGGFLAENLASLVGPAGAGLAAVGVVVVSLLAATEISFASMVSDTRFVATHGTARLFELFDARRRLEDEDAEAEEATAPAEPETEKPKAKRKRKGAKDEVESPAVDSALPSEASAPPIVGAPSTGPRPASVPPAAPDFLLPESDDGNAPTHIAKRAPTDPPRPEKAPERAAGERGSKPSPPARSLHDDDDASSDFGPEIIELKPDGPDRSMLEGDFEPPREPKKEYELPPLRLLDYDAPPEEPIDEAGLRDSAMKLEAKLKTYGVEGKVVAIRPGPVVTTYEYSPAPGVKVSKIASLTDDIAMSMEAERARIIAPIPGKGVVGIELPNRKRATVYLKEIIAHDRFQKSSGLLSLALGKDTEGETQVRDLQKMPHLLVAGTTGSGKSVSVNTMIMSILYKATPEQVKFIMVDPKMLELSLYADIPHLLLPVVTDAKKAAQALAWAVDEMERRYKLLSEYKVRNIEGFNKKLEALQQVSEDSEQPKEGLPRPMPYIVVLIDEFADLMCVAPRDIENSVQRLAQKARAAGIHVLLATQRPSTDVITGVIKNNFPSRISFQVASRHDSQTVINQPGAENLLGMGDSLWLGNTSPMPIRIHGAFVSEKEVERVADFWRAQARPVYDETILKPREEDGVDDIDDAERDEMYDRAVQIVTETRRASISAIQRRLRVGYNRAARMIEMMEKDGIVGPAVGPKGEREVLVSAMGPDGPEVS